MTNDWRIETDALTYFEHRQKEQQFEQRRPSPRKASDLGLGPGFGLSAVRVDDYNDILATFNGYYSSVPGALNAPNVSGRFVGFVSMDEEIGGIQVFTDMDTGVEYRRRFVRYPGDESVILWGDWVLGDSVPPTAVDSAPGWPTSVSAGGTLLPLKAPPLDVTGQAGVIESTYTSDSATSGVSIHLNSPGIYTGSILVSSLITLQCSVSVTVPYKGSLRTREVSYVSMGSGGLRVPFTAVHTGTSPGAIGVRASHNNAGAQNITWREFQCTRVGNAT